jgi:hypothetical protein
MTSQLYRKADGRLAPSILAERGSRACRVRLRSWILFTTQWGGLHNTNGTMGQAAPRTVPRKNDPRNFDWRLLSSCREPDRYAQVHARPPSTLQQSDWNIFRGPTLVKSRADRVPGHSHRELRHTSLRAGHVTLHAISEHSTLLRCLYVLFYLPCSTLALISMFQANITDPGAVPLGARPFVRVRRSGEVLPTERAIRRCHKCQNNYKPDRAHHDSMTGRCIVKFDHFCPWINNAVGALNHKHFCLFLLYTATSCLVSLLLIVGRWIQCGGRGGGGAREGALDTDSSSTSDGSAIDMHNDNPNGHNKVGGCCCRCYSRSISARYPAATLVPVCTLAKAGS